MRTAVACLLLAAAIATPGIVLAATSSSPALQTFVSNLQTSTVHPIEPGPIDPALQPVVEAVTDAFSSRGTPLTVEPVAPTVVEAFHVSSAGGCPIFLQFRLAGSTSYPPMSCPSTTTRVGQVIVAYGPPRLRPIVDAALARLRGNAR